MSSTDPQHHASPGSPDTQAGKNPTPLSDDARRFYAQWTGWLVLAIVIGYAGLQMPLPWRIVTAVAALAGITGGIALFVQAIRRRLSALTLASAVAVTLCCGVFLVSAGTQLLFWEASAAYDACLSSAVTERATDRCYSDYEDAVMSSIPGVP